IAEAVMSEQIGDGDMAPDHRAGGAASRLSASEWLLLLVLAAVQFTHIVDFMIIMPLGPVYIREMGLTTEQFSSVIAAYTGSAGLPLGLQVADMFNWHYPFIALGGLGAASLALAYFVLPPLRGHLGRRPARSGALWHVLTDANHLRAYTLMVALVLSTFMIFPLLATYL